MRYTRCLHPSGLVGLVLVLVAPGLSAQGLDPACDLLGADCVRIHQALGANRLVEAATVAERALEAADSPEGADSLAVAQAIDQLVGVRYSLGRGREPATTALAERAVAIRKRVQGESHPELIVSLHNLARLRRQAGDFESSRALTTRALAIAEAQLGAGHAVTAHSLAELSVAQGNASDFAAAADSAQRALDVAEALQPPDPILVAEAANALGAARFCQRDVAGALPLFRRALALYERVQGPNHLMVARTAGNLGMAARIAGDREEGEALLRRALGIYDRVAPGHPNVPANLNSLALIARSRGEYDEARRLWERALETAERAFGDEHPDVAGVLNNLANLRKLTGDYAAAEALLARSLAIRERVRGPEHPEVAQALTNLAAVQVEGGRCVEARASAERALAIREKAVGPDSVQAGQSLLIVGGARLCQGDATGARAAYERAVSIFIRVGSASGADTVGALHGLATALHGQGNLEAAAEVYRRSLEEGERRLDPAHPRVGWVLEHYGLLLAQRGDRAGAMEVALRAERIGRDHLRLTCRSLSEREALAYAASRPRGLDLALSLVADGTATPDHVRTVLEELMRSRTLVLDEVIARSRRQSAGDERAAMLQRRVAEAANVLVGLLVRGPGKDGPERYRRDLAEAHERMDAAERAVAEQHASRPDHGAEPTLARIQEALPPGSALLAFARYSHQPLQSLAATGGVPSYLAFIVSRGGAPAVLPLGPAAAIEDAVRAWQAEVARAPGRDRAGADAAEAACRVAGERLRAAIWDPLIGQVGDARSVFVVPEGVLHLVHLDALPRTGGGYLIEALPAIHQLTAEKDLLVAPRGSRRGVGLLAMGGARFDLPVAVGRPTAASASVVRATPAGPVCPEFQRIRFAPLPQTGSEVKEIARVFERSAAGIASQQAAAVLRGSQATESAFRRLAPGKRILHLATHGFFLGEGCRAVEPAARGIGGLVSTAEPISPRTTGDTTLRLAGLALAGANQRDTAASPADDGILTAEEIAVLDLDGVEWAVLSACESGAGTVAIGEGVLGLRRAFLIAGARSVIMSLWAADDAAARAWMNALYRARLEHGLSTAEAVREAGLQVLQTRRLEGLSTHPFYWAGFVAAGDWR